MYACTDSRFNDETAKDKIDCLQRGDDGDADGDSDSHRPSHNVLGVAYETTGYVFVFTSLRESVVGVRGSEVFPKRSLPFVYPF